MNRAFPRTFPFDAQNIDAFSTQIADALNYRGVPRRDTYACRLFFEEISSVLQDKLKAQTYQRKIINRRKHVIIEISVAGSPFNPLEQNDDGLPGEILDSLIPRLPGTADYRYENGRNIIRMTWQAPLGKWGRIRAVLKSLSADRHWLTPFFTLRALEMLVSFATPILSAQIATAYAMSEINRIILLAVLLFAANILASVFLHFGKSIFIKASHGILSDVNMRLAEQTVELHTEVIDDSGSGVFISRLSTDTISAMNSLDRVVGSSLKLLSLVGTFIAILQLYPPLAIYEFALLLVFVELQRRHIINQNRLDAAYRSANERYTGFISELIRGNRDIKTLNIKGNFTDRMRDIVRNLVESRQSLNQNENGFQTARASLNYVVSFGFLLILALLLAKGSISAASAVALFSMNGDVFFSAMAFGWLSNDVRDLFVSFDRLSQVFLDEGFAKEQFGTLHLNAVAGDIEFRGASFAYKGNTTQPAHASDAANSHRMARSIPVLRNFNLHIQAGQTIGLIGKSGCGKTTVLNLIERLYDLDEGDLLVDGHDIRELDEPTLRGNIMMVSQAPYIFHATIRENLALTKSDATEDEMIKACKLACIYDDIALLPNGLDTVVGEGGINLSGGQRQRLAIARCLLKRPKVMLLDEATSALDNVAQEKVQEALEQIHGMQTCIIVAHRLSTTRNCDCLYFIDGGTIKAQGTHEELLETCAEYRDLYRFETARTSPDTGDSSVCFPT